jgi:hypothetical protein
MAGRTVSHDHAVALSRPPWIGVSPILYGRTIAHVPAFDSY